MRLAGVYYPNLRNQLSQSARQAIKVTAKDLSAAGWVARSQRALERQDYREACLCLYLAMLQQLQEINRIPQLASRTDGEYLELLRQFPQFPAYQTLLIAHQQLCFGDRTADPSLFSQCDRAYQIICQHQGP
ncbi:MAG: DUF4129 domain-containing protein [Chloroflexaceae bacterium]|nr:DUF4129 domain-containing protein [Chloroflexaceae bacterium]